jgi:alkylation response protein AidB-like acyl-CoA dehydrogenase
VTFVADIGVAGVLEAIAAGAAARDAAPAFPHEPFALLERAGLLTPAPTRAEEWATVRAVARADGSVGRLYEGHLNAVERLAVHRLDARGYRLGVWGADPAAGEGEPAALQARDDGLVLNGVKVFCSGAGGLDRALVTARHPDGGAPRLAYVDLTGIEVDRDWYRAGGMRASESHRVVFHTAPVLALLGEPGEIVKEPWFSRDAIRTAAAWAGIADCAADAALADLRARPELDDLRALAAGRIVTAVATIDRWFEHAARAADTDDLRDVSVQLRVSVAQAGATILDEASRACGSRPFATGTALDRARRDFELFVLQHRLDPLLVRLGRAS